MSASRPVTMADLTDGTRVRHIHWETTGTIAVADGEAEIRWDDTHVRSNVSLEGHVFPSDLEILSPDRRRS